jgi:hypothetical protein
MNFKKEIKVFFKGQGAPWEVKGHTMPRRSTS